MKIDFGSSEPLIRPHVLGIAWLIVSVFSGYGQMPQGKSNLQFDVASIRLAKAGEPSRIKAAESGDGYIAQGSPVITMISLMYHVAEGQIKGAPTWLKDDRYDIAAKTDARYNLDDLHTMFQSMLADRFGLKFHWETKPGDAYLLTVDKSGSKLKENDTPQDYKTTVAATGKPGTFGFTREPMEHFSWWLGLVLQQDQRPVVDMTALKGNYDFTLTFIPPLMRGMPLPAEEQDLPSIFDAVRNQLGLRLTPQRASVKFMVIDHVERPEGN